MKKALLCLVLVGGSLFLFSSVSEGFLISDGTFNESDWEHIVIWDQTPGGGSFSTIQASAGGNPGYYQQGLHTYGPGYVRYGHIFAGGSNYDPSFSGSVQSIDYSFDFVVLTAMSSGSPDVAASLLVRQDNRYFRTPLINFTWGDPWKSFSGSVVASDFREITSSGEINALPDFSSSGSLIEFGYVSANRTDITNNFHDFGIDNYRVDVNVVPNPNAVWLLGSGLITLVGLRKKFKK